MPTFARPALLFGLVLALLFAVVLIGPRLGRPLGMDLSVEPALAELAEGLQTGPTWTTDWQARPHGFISRRTSAAVWWPGSSHSAMLLPNSHPLTRNSSRS